MDSIRSKCTTCQPGGSGRLSKAIRLWTGFGIKTLLADDWPIKSVDVQLLKIFELARRLRTVGANFVKQAPLKLSLAASFLLSSLSHIYANTRMPYPQTFCQ